MAIGYTYNPANMKQDGIASLYLKHGSDVAYYSIGPLMNGVVTPKTVSEPDQRQRNRPLSVSFSAKARMLSTAEALVIKLLQNLGVADYSFIINTFGGATYSGRCGVSWSLVSDSDFDKFRYIEITLDAFYLINKGAGSQPDMALLVAAPPAVGTPNVGDVLYTWAAGLVGVNFGANSAPESAVVFSVKRQIDGSYENVGLFRKLKFSFKSVGSLNGQRMTYNAAIYGDIEAEGMQTSAELAFLTNVTDLSYKLTLSDGLILTIPTSLGADWENSLATDNKDIAVIKYLGKGTIDLSAWAGLWT